MKRSKRNSTTATSAPSRTQPRGAERRELVRRGLEERKSQRQIARELGCDEGTVRRDIATMSLPADNLIAIQKGDTVEKHLDEVRFEKTGRDQAAIKKRRKRLWEENKKSGVHSDEAAKAVSAWLVKKEPYTAHQQAYLKHVKEFCENIPDLQRTPRSDIARVFAVCERGELAHPSTDGIDYCPRVMVSALIRIAPEKVIRDAAIKKALQAARSRKPYPPEPPAWAIGKAQQKKRRQLRDPAYEI
jgi:hypothetical protein